MRLTVGLVLILALVAPVLEAALPRSDLFADVMEPSTEVEEPQVEAAPDLLEPTAEGEEPQVEAAPDLPEPTAEVEEPQVEAAPDLLEPTSEVEEPQVEAAPDLPEPAAEVEEPQVEAVEAPAGVEGPPTDATEAAGATTLPPMGPLEPVPEPVAAPPPPETPGPLASPATAPATPTPVPSPPPSVAGPVAPLRSKGTPSATSAATPTPRPTANVAVAIIDFSFKPASLSVQAGDVITWTNNDQALHTTTSDDGAWDSSLLARGQSFPVKFTTAGTFPYFCAVHPYMRGSVTVAGEPEPTGPKGTLPAATPAATPTPTPPTTFAQTGGGGSGEGRPTILDFEFRPSSMNLRVGNSVTWSNIGPSPHTSTSDTGVWDSGLMNTGQSFSFTFARPGTFPYFCAIHPFMRATVNVTAPLAAPAGSATPTTSGTPGTPTPTAPPGVGTPTPTASPPVSQLGGKGFGLQPSAGGVRLSWQGGSLQTGYLISRSSSRGINILPPTGLPLPASATTFTDASTLAELACYTLLALGGRPAAPVGVSDLLCVIPNTGSATGAARELTIRLNQSNVASFTWAAPLAGGQDGFVLLPIGGTPITLGGDATRATHSMSGPTCYVLLTMRNRAPVGNTDVVCGMPGVATLGAAGLSQQFETLLRTVRGPRGR